ncbi:MAG: alpha/beta hydrolase family protein [Mobilitalea sp.]
MAVITVDFTSISIMKRTTFRVILPIEWNWTSNPYEKEIKPFRTLYLLHGIFGDSSDWILNTEIERYATQHQIAVVMPSGDNSFYLDNEIRNDNYGKYIGEELVAYTRKMFPLSSNREDTFIGGLSMGGYGAIRNGLKYSDTFGAIIGLSSALVNYVVPESDNEKDFFIQRRSYFESIFGDLDKLTVSDKNPDALIMKLIESKKKIPRIYMACGTEDDLLGVGRHFKDFLIDHKVEHEYKEAPGVHDWIFWNTFIQDALQWLDI